MTLEQAINLWLDTCATRGVAPTTAMRKRSTAKTHVCKPPFDKMQISALTKDDMDTILDSMVKPDGAPLSYSSKKKAFELVNACINYWVGEQVLERNPLVNYRLKTDGDRKSKRPLSYSEDEMKKIMAVLCESKPDGSPRYVCAPIARFAYNTGMRIGELIALKWENIYLDKEPPYITVNSHAVMVSKSEAEREKKKSAPKGAASKDKYVLEVIDGAKTSSGKRVIPLNSRALEILESQKEKSPSMCGFVFRNTKGKAMSGTLITRSWHRALTAAGISKGKIHGIHILRHTFATELVSRGGNIKNVADILGHKSARITMDYYLHPRVEDYAPTGALIEDLVKS